MTQSCSKFRMQLIHIYKEKAIETVFLGGRFKYLVGKKNNSMKINQEEDGYAKLILH